MNSTISGNSGSGWGGGGIYTKGTADIANSTFSDNVSQDTDALLRGGAVYGFSAAISITNSILANSTASNDCQAATIDAHTIVEDGSCDAIVSGDPGLLPLANNSGPTKTHLLSKDSIALNTGNNATCLEGDQRFNERALSVADACDVGSLEFVNSDIKGFYVIPLANGKVVVIPE